MSVNPVPEGFRTVTPYLIVNSAPRLIDFLVRAFDAVETRRSTLPDGSIMNSELRIGDSMIMLGEAMDGWRHLPSVLYLYVPDADAVYRRALEAGATSISTPRDEFYGDRTAGVKDWHGNFWWIATRKEDLSKDELDRRVRQYAERRDEERRNKKTIGFH